MEFYQNTRVAPPTTTPFHYISPNLTLLIPKIDHHRNLDLQSQVFRKKLHLILDLDKTLIHSTRFDRLSPTDRSFVSSLSFDHQPQSQHHNHDIRQMMTVDGLYVVKLRPGVKAFLQELSSMFDMSIYTMASRPYAMLVAKILDPEGRLFKYIICREDCTTLGQKGLDVLLCHERRVLIVDDTKDVWRAHTANLVDIAPYRFFGSTILDIQTLLKVESWSSMDVELMRVLKTLRAVHTVFYDGKSNYESKDVREVLPFVLRHKLYDIEDLDEDEDGLEDDFMDVDSDNLVGTLKSGYDIDACNLSNMVGFGAMQLSSVSAC